METHVILIGHGNLGHAMKDSAEMIVGALAAKISSLDFQKEEGFDTVEEKIRQEIQSNPAASYLIFTDLFGGTPYNASCSLSMKNPDQNIEVVTGMSLPLVLSCACSEEDLSAKEMGVCVVETAPGTVCLFAPETEDDEEDF